jgi:adenylate cyclase
VEKVQRKLAAIVAADVVGYSRLMGDDEVGTLGRLKDLRREIVHPAVAQHGGTVVKTTGDGWLLEFPSALEAVDFAVSVQRELGERNRDTPERRLQLRIGINVGDVIVEEDGDIFGDGVNVAARLEAIAEPGGVCISRTVRDQIRDKLPYELRDLGEHQVKNIARPVRVFAVSPFPPAETRTSISRASNEPPLAPDKPSIAVLPFANLSGDPEQEYFADGLTEEIITALSRVRSFFVIARNSTSTYKERSVDVRLVAKELGVRYVLEGSVRQAANRLRITGQLIDASTGNHLWADRFEGAGEDVFELQDRITRCVATIEPAVTHAEIARTHATRPSNIGAYDCYLRALHEGHLQSREGIETALTLLSTATRLAPRYAVAHGLMSYCYVNRVAQNWYVDYDDEVRLGVAAARNAAQFGNEDPTAMYMAGHTIAYLGRDYDERYRAHRRRLGAESEQHRSLDLRRLRPELSR